ncbi:TlyA family RNA methyltransferase [Spiroplasma turonicum]|uniref:rRNA methyltransferase n=1 Tax=Spiroplasma turonicum TaxID=216946 RepID=A0A0K1P5Z6_9MOLU|nr:TlyA family RNA methyltransferase [Spiroplasma turonicum]AKU79726.1 rRNA methyltransferase [Spiroplasma turonicum]ALX70744.1 rRNA methyltransferase [Spiroplasma turonicum]
MKERLDQIIVNKCLLDNKSKARAFIMDGKVIVNNEKVTKPGTMFDSEKVIIKILNDQNEFVSRAGRKLQSAVEYWQIDLLNKVCLDIGSSTGGFTDCCLKNNASNVFAIDVGTNQLDYKLRTNSKVISMENTNFRYVNKDNFDRKIDFFCCDVSFISLEKILIPLRDIVEEGTTGVVLIKPQFECDKEDIKNGKINSKDNHIKAIKRVVNYAIENDFRIIDMSYSPILGNKKKNIEYLCYIIKSKNDIKYNFDEIKISNLVKECWIHFYDKQ